ncbi:ribosome maturation factor RimM [Aurantiacibacter xanthus]|uniref:ribosome maturation factor RimM n=1 Tax=Aurantiacibacter xanthus TaxID=1784712 RepID=UPI001FE6341D|nr:ribosome maturation factor RimM [Aurantiacibacter xanthus]
MPENQAQTITLAAIAGAHGVTGEVRLKLFGEGLPSLKQHKSFNEGALTLAKLRDDGKGGAIARFAEVTSRTDAEKLRGTVLAVPREALPPLAEGEYYHADLIGLPAVSDTGEALGRVIAVENFGASDIIEIERPAEEGKKPQRFMVPMLPEAVLSWDATGMVISADFAED